MDADGNAVVRATDGERTLRNEGSDGTEVLVDGQNPPLPGWTDDGDVAWMREEWDQTVYAPGTCGAWPPQYLGEGFEEYSRTLTTWTSSAITFEEFRRRRTVAACLRIDLGARRIETPPQSSDGEASGAETSSTDVGTSDDDNDTDGDGW